MQNHDTYTTSYKKINIIFAQKVHAAKEGKAWHLITTIEHAG